MNQTHRRTPLGAGHTPKPSMWWTGLVGVLRQPDFLKLWSGLTVSLVGTQVSGLALPLTAVLFLGASGTEMGILGAARWLPYLVFGLLAGAWLDRVRRRPVLIATHVGRALLLASIPAGAVFGWLRIEQLYVVTLVLGSLMIFSDAAYQALLPTLVTREDLVDGNSKLELSRSTAQIVGPGLGGWLVQLVGAPLAVAVDAVAFAFDAMLVTSIRQAEPPPVGAKDGHNLRREIAEGLRWVFGSPVLRPIQAASMSFIGANAVWGTVYVLYATRDLHLAPAVLGLIFAAGGPGALAGALAAGAFTRRFGLGFVIVGTHALAAANFFLIPLAVVLAWLAIPLLMAAAFVGGCAITLGSIAELSLRQGMTPHRLQGRMNATMRSLNWSMAALGSLIGGFLGDAIGFVPTLLIGAGTSLASTAWLVFSPIPRLREAPEVESDVDPS
ncbi:MAG: MFS transporter [Chloroflexota bacterium]|nr:MFS transporter [Chloroflexota bacterium]